MVFLFGSPCWARTNDTAVDETPDVRRNSEHIQSTLAVPGISLPGGGNPPTIPDHIRMEIARCLLPDIIAFCESEQGKREFEEWKKKRMVENKEEKKLYKKIGRASCRERV